MHGIDAVSVETGESIFPFGDVACDVGSNGVDVAAVEVTIFPY